MTLMSMSIFRRQCPNCHWFARLERTNFARLMLVLFVPLLGVLLFFLSMGVWGVWFFFLIYFILGALLHTVTGKLICFPPGDPTWIPGDRIERLGESDD